MGEKTFLLLENESTYISPGTIHRLANPSRVSLHLVKVQCGTYVGDDNMVHFDDIYGRAKKGWILLPLGFVRIRLPRR